MTAFVCEKIQKIENDNKGTMFLCCSAFRVSVASLNALCHIFRSVAE
jgi:hypothetical protein